ncbi:MAG: radical SAM/SPASM domain-containing protein [Alphaproteobacteria bacterium]|nr:radical SAM/SPASM domain-containing protein [Alphaproteobacteria bacterium]
MKIPVLASLEKTLRHAIKGKKKAKNKGSVLLTNVILDISYYCNASCPFCPRQLLSPKISGFMSKEIFYTSMKQIEQMESVKIITLAAEGEPLMHPDFDEFVDYLKSKNYTVIFPTNMALAHKHFDAMMKCDEIMYSIEGDDKESYESSRINLNFEQVFENIKKFHELVEERRKKGLHTPNTSINFIVTKESRIKKFIELWHPFVDFLRIGPVGPVMNYNKKTKKIEPKANEKMEKILLPLGKNPVKFCTQPFNITVIKPDGKMGLCCSDFNIDINFGSYKNIKKDFYCNKNLNKIRKEFLNKKLTLCENCPQHLMITRKDYEKYLPELKNIEEKYKNVTVYALR